MPDIIDPRTPQPGAQTQFLQSTADIVIFGGGCGAGKSYGLLLSCLAHVDDHPDYRFIYFRRTHSQLSRPGGTLDMANTIFPSAGGMFSRTRSEWAFPSGALGQFYPLEYDLSIEAFGASRFGMVAFDGLRQFSQRQFWAMYESVARPERHGRYRHQLRATIDVGDDEHIALGLYPDTWTSKLLAPWWDKSVAPSIAAKSGDVRRFSRHGEDIIWLNELACRSFGDATISISYISSLQFDNEALVYRCPEYVAALRDVYGR